MVRHSHSGELVGDWSERKMLWIALYFLVLLLSRSCEGTRLMTEGHIVSAPESSRIYHHYHRFYLEGYGKSSSSTYTTPSYSSDFQTFIVPSGVTQISKFPSK